MPARLSIALPIFGLLAASLLATSAQAGILLFLDDVDDHRFVAEVVAGEPVQAQKREIDRLKEMVMKLDRPAIAKRFGGPSPKPPKAFAMPLGETRGIGLSGLRATSDERPDEHFINFHPIGDYAAVEVYYARTETGNEPIAVRVYLRCDESFERLNKDNVDRRLTWEWDRLLKLAKVLEAKP